jgi:probable addiction module antidote protein
MALETFPYDTAEYLENERLIYLYLETELEENEMPYLAHAVATVCRARGGVEVVAAQTGLPIDVLNRAADETKSPDRDAVIKSMEAYWQRESSDSQVA